MKGDDFTKKERYCVICGEKIDDNGLKYCGRCRRSGNYQKQLTYIAKRRKEAQAEKEARGKLLSIRDVNRIAFEVGLNYGVVSHILNEKKLNRKPYEVALKAVRSVLK